MTDGSKLRRLWFAFWDEPDLRRTTLVGAATSIAVLLIALSLESLTSAGYPSENYGVWLFFSVAIGYVLANGTYLLPKTLEDLDALRPISSLDDAAFQRLRYNAMHHPRLTQHLQTVVGICAGITHDFIIGGVSSSVLSWEAPASSALYFSSFCTIALWTLMFQLGGALIRNAITFARLGREHVRISIFDRTPLAAFGRTALRPALLLVGVQVAYPLLWIQSDFRYAQALPGFFATVGVILATFFIPLIGIHGRLLESKHQAIARVTTAICSVEDVLETAQALRSDGERSRLAELVTLRREIEASTSWPIDLPVMRHLGVYLILPPLTWVGAALIENAVEALL